MNSQHRRRRAFSLIELLVVMVIMAILLAIIVGAIRRMETSHQRGETISRMHAVARALSMYRADYGDVPPFNPTGTVGVPDGPGLWSLVMLRYLQSYRFLHDAGYGDPNLPWVRDSGGSRFNSVIPDSDASLLDAYNAVTGGSQATPLLPQQRYTVFAALGAPAAHSTTGPPTDFNAYDDENNENWCSWQMQDPFTQEWKYMPVRFSVGGSATPWVTNDPTQPTYYRRQLSHRGTDDDSPRYLPASDTVVTWSSAFRNRETREAPQYGKAAWGIDIVLYADGHVSIVPAPDSSGWAPVRALLRAPAP